MALKSHLLPFLLLYLAWILIFYLFGLYDLIKIKPTITQIRRFGLALILSFVVGIFLFYFVPIFGISPKTNLLFELVGFGILSFLVRRIVYLLFSKQIVRPTVLVGEKACLDELNSAIKGNPQLGLQIISYTNDLDNSIKKYGSLKNSLFIFENISGKIAEENIVTLYENKAEIMEGVGAYEAYLAKIPTNYISQSWIIENLSARQNFFYAFTSRILDITVSVAVLVIFSPFLLLAVCLIFLYDRGPVFYTHERIGLNRKIFRIYKLRSMVVNSETDGIAWASVDDTRITPVGRVIRKLHLDEIPQMFNIIRGNMTLIGPRPERPGFVKILEEAIPHYRLRHVIRPGFTGWAQIKYRYARSIEDSKEKFEYDLYYLKNRNIFLDFGIILKTIQIIFTH